MGLKGPVSLGFLLLFFLINTPTDARQCNLNCAGTTGNLLKFQPGKTYQYKLEGTSVTTLPGAKNDVSKLGIDAKVEVSAAAGCEHVIVVTGVKTTGPDGQKFNLDNTLGSNPLKFALQNGKIIDLCTSDTESDHALNIKRAVLSLIQSTVLKESGYALQHETDIFGSCPTNFEFSKQGASVIVKKIKDLTKCAHREDLNLPYSTSSYFVQSEFQTSPLMAASLNVEQKLEGGLLKYASSEEVYNYNPVYGTESATTIKVKTKLSFLGQNDNPAPPVTATKGKSLVFQADHPTQYKGSVQTIVELLKVSCDSRTVQADGAAKFSKLVRVMAGAPKAELLQVFKQVKSGQGFKEPDIAKKMYIDAVVEAKSSSSIEVMAELLKSKEVTGYEAIHFYALLGSVKHPSTASLQSVTPLLVGNAPTELFLGAGALGGRFCKEHNCAKYNEVETFQTKLAAPLLTKGCKPANKNEEDTLIASLKGVTNMKFLTKPVIKKLADNAVDSDVKARVRVALFEAMRSDANKPEFKTAAGEVFKNPLEDSEVRIKAYLVLAECPCGKVAALIKSVLENEKSFQVGGFVVSHLRNLRASTNPEKAHAKHHLGPIVRSQKYPLDFRKYSQNFELSYSADMLNLGASGESNVIYSQKSYVPRSVSLNLTTFMFGHSLNWLEVDVRAENVEKVLEKVFGPRGKLRKNKYNEVYEEGREYATSLLESAAEHYEKTLRPKRSVSRDQLNVLANKVDLHQESEDDVDLDVSLKAYGAELLWLKYHHKENKIDAHRAVDKFFGGLDGALNSAKHLNFDHRKQFTFLDEEIVYPTAMGLPLKLKSIGSTAVRVKVNGKFDVPALLKDPKNTDVRLQVIPSAAVEMRGDIVIDGIAVEAGVKVAINLHTSTGSDMTFRVIDGKGVDVKFGLPVKKQDILTLDTDVSTVIKQKNSLEKTVPIDFDVKREKYNGCFDQLNEILGITVCGEVDVPWEGHRSLSPAYGPSKLSLHVDKDDDSLTNYHFKVYGDDREGVKSFEVLFDTPNSRENRKVSLNVEGTLEGNKKYVTVNLKSPWTSVLFDGSLVTTPKELSVNAKFVHDDIEYYLKTGAIKSQKGNVIRYEPLLEYKAPDQATKSALVGRRGGPKPTSQVVTLSGAVVVESNDAGKKWKYENLALNTPRTKYSIDGSGSVTQHGGDVDVVVHYDKEHIKVKGAYKEKDNHLNTQLTVLPSQYPDFNINLKWDAVKDVEPGKYESKLSVIHGPDPNSETNKIFVHNKVDLNKQEGTFGTENTVTYPVLNLDGHVEFRVTPKSVKTDLSGKFDKYSAQLLLKGEVNTKKDGDYNAEAKWELMGNSVGLIMSRKVLKNHQSKFNNVLDIKPGGKYELDIHATHKFNDKDIDYSVDIDLKLPAEPKNVKVKGGFKHNDVESKGHLNAVSGNKQYLQSDYNVKLGEKPSGSYKFKMLDYVNSNGDFLFDGKNFKAKTKLDLPKVQRQMEGKANFEVSDTKFVGSVDYCWDTKNPSKTVKFQTDTSVQDNAIESKNTLTFAGQKTALNLKGSATGEEEKGSVGGEVELTLPHGHRMQLTLSDSHDLTNNKNMQGEVLAELLLQEGGKEPYKATVKLVGKNIDEENFNFDTQFSVKLETADKKDLNSHLNLKKTAKDDKKNILKGELAASGSLMEYPVTLKIDSELSNELFDDDDSNELESLPPVNYHLILDCGSGVHVESSGKMGGNTITGDLNAKLPKDSPVHTIKWSTSNIIDFTNADEKHKLKSSNELHWNNDKFIKVTGETNCEPNGFNYVAEWETNNLSKRKLAGSAHWIEDANSRKGDANAALTWEGKSADVSLKAERNNENVGTIHLIGNTPDHGKFDFMLKNKIVKNGKGLHSDLALTTKDKKVAVSSKIELIEQHPLFDLVIDHPDGTSRFFWKVDVKGERHWTQEIKAKWTGERGGNIAIDSEVFLKSIDNFFIKHNADAPHMGLRKIVVDLSNKPGRGEGKKITFTVKKDEKLLVSASSNYVVKQDGEETVVEGNGVVKMEDKQYPLNFKGSWIVNENERAAKVLVKTGKNSINVVLKRNKDEFNFERTFCTEGKCSKAQILNKIRSSGFEDYEHAVVIAIDLHLMNRGLRDLYYEGNYKRKGQQVDHLVVAKSGDEVKFKYNGYIHDKEAGVLITFPKRTVGLDFHHDINAGGNSKIEANLYLNKEKNDKLCLLSTSNVEKSGDFVKVTGETKISHPTLKKDLSVKGHYTTKALEVEAGLVVDVFKNDNEKIRINLKSATVKENNKYKTHSVATIKSPGCKLDVLYDSRLALDESSLSWIEKFSYVDSQGVTRESLGKYLYSPKKIYFIIKVPAATIIEADWKVDMNNKEIKGIFDTTIGTKKYRETADYNKDKNRVVYSITEGSNSINIEFGALMGKSADFKLGMNNKLCTHVEVSLDETNFLKSTYNYDPEVMKTIWHSVAEELNEQTEELRAISLDSLKKDQAEISHFVHCLTQCIPNFDGLLNHLTEEFKHMKDEALADADISNAVNHLREGFGTLLEHITLFIEELNKLLTTIGQYVNELSQKMLEVLKEVGPKLADALDKFTKMIVSLMEQYLKICLQLMEQIGDELKKYKEDLDAFAKVLSDLVHEVGKQIAKVVHSIHEEIQKFIELNLEQLKELPITNMIKEKLNELSEMKLPEEAWLVYNEMIETLKQFFPTQECEDFVYTLSSYIEKVLKHEPVDSAEAGKVLYDKFIEAVKSLLTKVNEVAPKEGLFKPEQYVTMPLASWLKLPVGGIRVSVINLLRSDDFLGIIGSLETFALALNPIDNIPPFLGFAQIIDSTEVITFDGRHYGIKGLCSYVLAEDYVDRNFSIVGHFKDGKLEAITAWDESHSITLRNNAAPLKDGLEAEFPLKAGLLKAWKTPYGVGLRSKAGLILICSHEINSCTLQVSGFYFNKLRGLFGNFNYERYDELILPEGTIGSDSAQFCNSWKVDNACPDVPAIPHTHQRQRICTEMFTSEDSDLILGRPWLPFEPYRDACDHLVASATEDKNKAACIVASNYVLHAQKKGAILLDVPSECIVCKINNKKIDEDDSTIVTPGKAADVVFLVDVLKENEDTYKKFIQPLVPKLKAELQKNGINDIHIVLLSFNSPSNKWPNYHSVHGKLEFNGHDCVLEFEEKPEPRNETWLDRLIEQKHSLYGHLGSSQKMKAYQEVVNNYNFRPQALKTIIAAHSERCDSGSFLNFIIPLRIFIKSYEAMDKGIVLNLVTPISGLTTAPKAGVTNNDIVGFTDEEMYTMNKGTVKGELDHDTDYCLAAAHVTGGVVFPTSNFNDFSKEGKGDVFIQKAAEQIVKSIVTNSKSPLECECGLFSGIVPKPECELDY